MLLEVITKGDDDFLSRVNNKVKHFSTFFEDIIHQKGIKWDDIIIKFRW